MKILHVNFLSPYTFSGINEVLMNLKEAQNKILNISSKILFVGNYKNKDHLIPLDQRLSDSIICHGINEVETHISSYGPDIVIFHGYFNLNYYHISRVLTEKKIKYLIQPHSSFDKNSYKKSYIKKLMANFFFLNFFRKNASAIIYLNYSEMENSKYKNIEKVFISNGVDIVDYEYIRHDPNQIYLFYIGRIDFYHKGIDILIGIINYLLIHFSFPFKLNLNIYGNGNPKQIKKLKKLISKNDNIKYYGPVYKEEKTNAFKKNDIFILTSRYEGLPIAILEALSFGKPIIVSKGTNMGYLINNNDIGIEIDLKNINYKLIYDFISSYQTNSNTIFTRATNIIKSQFNWNLIAEESIKKIKKYANKTL
jgi:glycosyltransferase involved in cell wall biosynthesis